MSRQALAAVFAGPGQPMELRRLAVPDPTGAEILVRVIGCTLCGSDLHTFEGRRSTPTPTILGHEILGRVERFGPDASRMDLAGRPIREGDRVTWAVVASCGSCFTCLRTLPQKCEHMVKYGHERLADRPRGGLAEFCVLAPGTAVVRIPDSIADETACPASCATATVAAGLRAAGSVRDRVVLVQGAGMLGLTACAMSAVAGAAEVLCTDLVPERLDRARLFGATCTALPGDLAGLVADRTDRRGVDVAFELTGWPSVFESGLSLLRLGGTYVLIGAVFPSEPVSLRVEALVRRQLTLRGIHNYAPEDLATAVEFLAASPDIPFPTLIDRWFPLADVEGALAHARQATVFRVGVRP